MTKVKLARERARAGVWNDVIEGAWERYKEGGREDLQGALAEELSDRAIARYDGKIRAMFARGGIQIDEGQELTTASVAEIISERTGLEFANLSPEAIASAVDKELSARLSEVLKVPVSTVFDKEKLLEDVKEGVKQAIADGRAWDLLSKGTLRAARAYATWKRRGIEGAERKRIQNAAAQKRYRRFNRLVWD